MSTPLGNTINSQVSSTYDTVAGITIVGGFVWDPDGLAWAKMTQPAAAEGAGSGLTDAQLRATDVKVTLDGESVPVTGTFWQVTQPVSIADAPTRDLGKVDIVSLDQYTPVSGRLPVDGSGVTQPVSIAGTVTVNGSGVTQPVSGPLTDTQLRATAVPVSGTVAVTGPLTDTQIRATALPVSGTFFQTTQPVSIASMPSTAVTGPLTDTQIRATPLPVSGTVAVTGPLTDTQLRAVAVPISAAALPLPSGAATEAGNLATIAAKDFATTAKQDTGNASLTTIAAKDFATTAKQDTGNTSLATISAKDFATETTLAKLALGQAVSGASTSGPMVQGLVDDAPPSYVVGVVAPLSLNTDGRLRVTVVDAATYIELFRDANPFFNVPNMCDLSDPFEVGAMNPWP